MYSSVTSNRVVQNRTPCPPMRKKIIETVDSENKVGFGALGQRQTQIYSTIGLEG